MSHVHPRFQAAIQPLRPAPDAGPCTECGKPLPAVYFGQTNWLAAGVCSARCWEDLHMDGPRHAAPSTEGEDA